MPVDRSGRRAIKASKHSLVSASRLELSLRPSARLGLAGPLFHPLRRAQPRQAPALSLDGRVNGWMQWVTRSTQESSDADGSQSYQGSHQPYTKRAGLRCAAQLLNHNLRGSCLSLSKEASRSSNRGLSPLQFDGQASYAMYGGIHVHSRRPLDSDFKRGNKPRAASAVCLSLARSLSLSLSLTHTRTHSQSQPSALVLLARQRIQIQAPSVQAGQRGAHPVY